LVDLIYRYEGRALVLRVLVDRPQGGILLDECARLNNQISRVLDESNLLQTRYILEVSSPGLDRPLKTKYDFLRCTDKRVRFFLASPLNGKIELDGIIKDADDEAVHIDINGEIIAVSLISINKAKQVID